MKTVKRRDGIAGDACQSRLRWPGGILTLLVPLALAASAQAQAVGLGTADSFAVLGGETVTNAGSTVITGDLGVSPGPDMGDAIVGFPPGVANGTIHDRDADAGQAQIDLTTAYNDAATRPSTANLTGIDLGFFNAANPLPPGVYTFDTSAGLTGNLTLDAGGDPDAVWIFQIGSTLTTASASSVSFVDGIGETCNVFWQVGNSATLGASTDFSGNILALTSITANTGATVAGSLLARIGSVTLDTNVVTGTQCVAPPPPPPPTPAPANCHGQAATRVGTPGNDTLLGTPGDDVIVALAGRDTVKGFGGRDLVCGRRGDDTLRGGGGVDVLRGGKNQDRLVGGAGRDKCFGGSGGDIANRCEVEKSI